MARLIFSALAVISLFPASCRGAKAFCAGGFIDKVTIDRDILATVNARRQALITGQQRNGRTGTKLPPAKGMTNVLENSRSFRFVEPIMAAGLLGGIREEAAGKRWSCELERIANGVLGGGCLSQPRFNRQGLADFFYSEYGPEYNYWAGKVLENALNAYLLQIDLYRLDVPSGATKVSYNGNEQLRTYANLVRSRNTQIGCAINQCFFTRDQDLATMYCVLNSRNITKGETIYRCA
ncbi:hypothetical protein Y032_0004g1772 [Ancylostoma ceylanicum]|uniref:SCP domain-containing protein n=1 Tax=Ancylostoma ceylanicum TaxID=53326 RepID=A0A016VTY7_9BILA|nr:hypothetical protein Y032_0004g1772 [Ancylostoma ceylanicum]